MTAFNENTIIVTPPADAEERKTKPPIICYRTDQLPTPHAELFDSRKLGLEKTAEIIIQPRDARTFKVTAGNFFRITSMEGPQVGDLNLWNEHNLAERFFSGKTRQLHATHVSTGDRLWSTLPGMRPMATITQDTLAWYGYDNDGAGIHDVIGTRCDPYTNHLLQGTDYHYCCHSNLTRALASTLNIELAEAETHIHDVLNVFMCTGFTRHSHQYFMKASPVRPDDYIEFFAEMDLLGALSTCPGGDCGSSHSSDETQCYPLKVEVFKPQPGALSNWTPGAPSGYNRTHGL